MRYLLDTNICIHFFRGKFDLIRKVENKKIKNCAISEITLAELVFGAENSLNPNKNHRVIEDFTKLITILPIFDSISFYGREKARLRNQGTMISDFDLLIGSTSVNHNLIMVTENTKEFDRILGIRIENWIDRTL